MWKVCKKKKKQHNSDNQVLIKVKNLPFEF